jgi:hypothetical protein
MNNQTEDSQKFPPARPEITAEVVAIDCLLADLIVRCQGNARELDHLFGILDEHLAICEQTRDTLLGIKANERQALTMTDLPLNEQRMIFGSGLLSAYLLEAVATITQSDSTVLGEKISQRVNIEVSELSDDEITDTLTKYLREHEQRVKSYKEAVEGLDNITLQRQEDNN